MSEQDITVQPVGRIEDLRVSEVRSGGTFAGFKFENTESCAHEDTEEAVFAEGNVDVICLKCGSQWPKSADLISDVD